MRTLLTQMNSISKLSALRCDKGYEIERTPCREVDVLLVLLLSNEAGLVLAQSTTDRTCLLVTEIEGKVYHSIRKSVL